MQCQLSINNLKRKEVPLTRNRISSPSSDSYLACIYQEQVLSSLKSDAVDFAWLGKNCPFFPPRRSSGTVPFAILYLPPLIGALLPGKLFWDQNFNVDQEFLFPTTISCQLISLHFNSLSFKASLFSSVVPLARNYPMPGLQIMPDGELWGTEPH